MSTIQEIKKYLDKHIGHSDTEDLIDLKLWFKQLEVDHWPNRVAFRKNKYNRISLINCDAYELLLLCWNPGHASSFHSHPSKGCLVKILEGRLDDELKLEGKDSQFRSHMTNEVLYISDKMGQHRVFNAQEDNAVSLHLYAPGGYEP